jgi:D-alanyl-D-alanine carboxypeptidase
VAISQHVGGSVETFVAMMNATAAELGMKHSSFANPNGLDHNDHYSTARDMAILARAALKNETLMRIASTRNVTIGGRTMTNHNKLLGLMEGCIGLKTGYTGRAGNCLLSAFRRDDGYILVGVFGCPEDSGRFADTITLVDYFGK